MIERKVIFEITGDGLTAEEVGRIRQVIRHLKRCSLRKRTTDSLQNIRAEGQRQDRSLRRSEGGE